KKVSIMTNENTLIEGGQQQSLAGGIDCTRLTAGIGHDFNHVLNIIRGYAELLLEELRQNDAAREKVMQINKAIDKRNVRPLGLTDNQNSQADLIAVRGSSRS